MATAVPGLSKGAINRAGARLRAWWEADGVPKIRDDNELVEAVAILFAFRSTFQAPLNKVTMGLRWFVQKEMQVLPADGKLPVGQRLKREPQIIRKLARHPQMNLSRMQDIGGCRAIPTGGAVEVQAILRRIQSNWEIKGSKDYVVDPAPSGYRAIHVVVLRDDHLVEIQLRTPRQHEWAEAVERTGLRTRFSLKDGEGPPDLLRYFALAAHGIALEETGQEVDEDFAQKFRKARADVIARGYFIRR